MISPNFQEYLNNMERGDNTDVLYLPLYEALEETVALGAPPTVDEFMACHKQTIERLAELDIQITEEDLLQTINGWMFVLLHDYPMFIIWYGRILGLTDEQWHKAIEEMREDLEDYYKDDNVMEDHLDWLENNCSVAGADA